MAGPAFDGSLKRQHYALFFFLFPGWLSLPSPLRGKRHFIVDLTQLLPRHQGHPPREGPQRSLLRSTPVAGPVQGSGEVDPCQEPEEKVASAACPCLGEVEARPC